MKQDNYTYLTQGPVAKVILSMAVPSIISMLVTSLYNAVDTFFVGQIDTPSTAAVGVVFPVMFFIQAVAFFFGNGTGNYLSRELGARRHANAEAMATTGFVYAVIAGVIICLLGELFLERLSLMLGSTPTILPYTRKYLSVILLGAPMMTGALCLNNQMRFQGNARFAVWGIVSGALVNIILDPVLIFGLNLGVVGAAWATIIGQTVSLLALLYLTYSPDNIPIHWRYFSGKSVYIREIIAGGTPSLSRQGLGCIATMLLNVSAAVYGDAAIAAMSVVSRITMFVFSMVVGLGQGFQPFCGYTYGAQMYDRLRHGFWFCVRVGTIFLIVVGILGGFYAYRIIGMFRNDSDVVEIGGLALLFQLITYPLNAFIMLGNMFTQTIRKPWRANLLASARHGLFFIPLIMILPCFFGLLGIQICQSVSDILTFILAVVVVRGLLKNLVKKD